MQRVKLVGEIAKFGSNWETDCRDIRDIFRLINCQTSGFRQHLISAAEAGIGYEIKRGEDYLESEDELLLSLNKEDIIITEVPAGAKGAGKIFAAIAIAILVIANPGTLFFTPGVAGAAGSLTAIGQFAVGLAVNLALTGIAEIMAPGPESDSQQEQGYLFDGPTNNVQQGLPVPVCYGELLVGGAPISLSFKPIFEGYSGSGRGRGSVAAFNFRPNIPVQGLLGSLPSTPTEEDDNQFEVQR
jgi:predicted phage tail protein